MWRKLLKYRDKAKDFHRVEVKNGQASSFWYDAWSDMGRLLDLTGARGCVDMEISLKASVANAVSQRPRRHRSDFYTMIEEAIYKQRSKMKTREDVSVWKFTADVFKPRFSTCNTWLLLRSPAPIVSWHSSIWFPHTTPKYAFMAWLAVHNRLTTGDRMLLWNVGIEASCILCKQHLETSDHLFFSCSYSQEVWSGLVQRLLSSLFSDQWRKESWCFLRIKGSRR